MIWDVFLFFNELDMLECRLTELQDSVDRFVLIEAPVTFQGNPKPLYYAEHKERFSPWKDKIIHVVADELPEGPVNEREHAFKREAAQREYAFRGVADAAPRDIVLLGDVDEIPRPEIVNERMWTGVALAMQLHMFCIDWLHPETWPATVVQRMAGVTSFQELRNLKSGWPRIAEAGHHFTYLGGPDAVRAKVASYSHTELREPICRFLEAGRLYSDGLAHGIWSKGKVTVQQAPVEIDETFPLWIRERKCPAGWFRPKPKEV